MITATILLFYLGYFMLTVASRRAVTYPPSFLEKFTKENRTWVKYIGLFLLLSAFAVQVGTNGLGTGMIGGVILLMAVIGTAFLLDPLRLLTLRDMLLIFLCLFILELAP